MLKGYGEDAIVCDDASSHLWLSKEQKAVRCGVFHLKIKCTCLTGLADAILQRYTMPPGEWAAAKHGSMIPASLYNLMMFIIYFPTIITGLPQSQQ
jgi:hypothetical protein